jgi:hypothetical protein
MGQNEAVDRHFNVASDLGYLPRDERNNVNTLDKIRS